MKRARYFWGQTYFQANISKFRFLFFWQRNNEPQKAAEILSKLKSDFETKFGKTVTGGGASKGFEMIEKLDKKIQVMLEERVEIKPSSLVSPKM